MNKVGHFQSATHTPSGGFDHRQRTYGEGGGLFPGARNDRLGGDHPPDPSRQLAGWLPGLIGEVTRLRRRNRRSKWPMDHHRHLPTIALAELYAWAYRRANPTAL
jgi:hypothetical protein